MSSPGSDGSDDQSADAQQLGSFSSIASWFNEVVVKVDCEYMDFYRDPKRGPTRSTKQQIYDRYCQLQYRKDGKTRQFISEWLHCESGMRVYKRFDLVPPGLHCDPDSFNLWTAWPCESFEAGDDREQLVNLLASVLKHVKILANHKKSNYDFVMKFFAQYVQFTHKKGGVMLILSGEEGCGKSTIMKLVKMMFGDHFLSTSKPEQNVWGKFNSELEGKTLVELSELDRGNVYGSIDHVKDLISNDTVWIEGKGKNGYNVPNYLRFVGVTNDPIPVQGGRRNGCVNCSSEFVQHKPLGGSSCSCPQCVQIEEYHTRMNEVVVSDKRAARILFEYWKTYDLEGRQVLTARDLPCNELQERVAEASEQQEQRFLRHLATLGTDSQATFTSEHMWHCFLAWRQEYEPGAENIIKTKNQLELRLGALWSKTSGCGKQERRVLIEVGGAQKYRKARVWSIDREEVCKSLGILFVDLDVDETQPTMENYVQEGAIPDLDAVASSFVDRYLSSRSSNEWENVDEAAIDRAVQANEAVSDDKSEAVSDGDEGAGLDRDEEIADSMDWDYD